MDDDIVAADTAVAEAVVAVDDDAVVAVDTVVVVDDDAVAAADEIVAGKVFDGGAAVVVEVAIVAAVGVDAAEEVAGGD